MVAGIRKVFSQFIEPGTRQGGAAGEHALQIATAALLMEMMRMDRRIADEECASVAATLRAQFGLDEAEVAELMRLADEEARQASGYHQFTSLINKSCDAAQKVRIVENLWRVAMADGHLDAHESHLMRRIADLLHVGHADYVAAKQRAREATGVPPA
jgi:uncharacterized tellurite resistance protein B-like protein